MQTFMKNQSKIFKQILINEDKFSTEVIKEIPVDIENTYIGRDISTLIDCFSGIDSISPYSDVSFRVLARIADILMARDSIKSYSIQEEKPTDEVLPIFQSRFYRKMIKQENDFWYDMPPGYHNELNDEE